MNRREAIETIKKAIAQVEWDYPMEIAAAFDFAIADMKICEANNAGWISVKDRYPDAAGVAVLVSATSQYGQQHVFEAFIGYGDFTWYTMDCTKMGNRRITCNEVSNNWKITHWMPLPEPPKEDGQ